MSASPLPNVGGLSGGLASSIYVFAFLILLFLIETYFLIYPDKWVSFTFGLMSASCFAVSMTTALPAEPYFGLIALVWSIFVMLRSYGVL